jgi:hypothetical protein
MRLCETQTIAMPQIDLINLPMHSLHIQMFTLEQSYMINKSRAHSHKDKSI